MDRDGHTNEHGDADGHGEGVGEGEEKVLGISMGRIWAREGYGHGEREDMSLGIGMGTEMSEGVKIHGPGKPSSVTDTCMSQKILSLSKAEDSS